MDRPTKEWVDEFLEACEQARSRGYSAPMLSAEEVDQLEAEVRALREEVAERATVTLHAEKVVNHLYNSPEMKAFEAGSIRFMQMESVFGNEPRKFIANVDALVKAALAAADMDRHELPDVDALDALEGALTPFEPDWTPLGEATGDDER